MTSPKYRAIRVLRHPPNLVSKAGDIFDLIVSTTSFDHWSDRQAGLVECARVLRPGGRLVLVDELSRWLVPTR